ncbi:Ig-like domain-containing protein [Streptomyces sp. SS]|uniref:Ig-like domain-containing protein n=1 Tax=Streptomyces sp. SS TaxID=260742 RepID=UPI0002E176CF|nr:Ig-like domain-containing protein [Streptomyces sp. SS]
MQAITIDTSQLTFPLVAVAVSETGSGSVAGAVPEYVDGAGHAARSGYGARPGTRFLDGAADPPPEVSLPPRTGYLLRPADSATAAVTFDVREDGTLDFAPEFDAFLDGRGGRRLTVRGVPVAVDARALDHPLVPELPDAEPLTPDRVHELRLLPAYGYRLRVSAGTADGGLRFSVSPDGRVRLDPEAAGFADASGHTLTVHGHTITVDGRGLSHGLLPVGASATVAGSLARTSTHRLTLLPASGYLLQAGPGVTADLAYAVRSDGTVDYEESCDPFLAGRGTDTLVVGGFPVVLSTVRADSDLLGVTALDSLPQTPRELTAVLAPATGYLARTAHGLCSAFGIARDGAFAIDPSASRSFAARPALATGSPTTLTVRVTATVPGGPPPRGAVTFSTDGRVLGTVLLDEVGMATLRTAHPPADGAGIVVSYEGDDDHGPCGVTVSSGSAGVPPALRSVLPVSQGDGGDAAAP